MTFHEMFRKMRYDITRNPKHRRPLKIWKGDGWVHKTWEGETFTSVWDRVPEAARVPCARGSSICRHTHHPDGSILRGENLDTVYVAMGARHGRPVCCQMGERRSPQPECQDRYCRFRHCDCYRCYPERFIGSSYCMKLTCRSRTSSHPGKTRAPAAAITAAKWADRQWCLTKCPSIAEG
ncbi:hypothetical protein ACJZ2D_011624 [Fusarium nematophilum]